MTDTRDLSAAAAYEEMYDTLEAANPAYLKTIDVNANNIIDQWKSYGESGKVFLMFLALRISAMAEKDEL